MSHPLKHIFGLTYLLPGLLRLVEVNLAEMLPDAGEEVGAGPGGEQREGAGLAWRGGYIE